MALRTTLPAITITPPLENYDKLNHPTQLPRIPKKKGSFTLSNTPTNSTILPRISLKREKSPPCQPCKLVSYSKRDNKDDVYKQAIRLTNGI